LWKKRNKLIHKVGHLCEFTKLVVEVGQQVALSKVQGTLLSARGRGLKKLIKIKIKIERTRSMELRSFQG
jgi:hypothetical protein